MQHMSNNDHKEISLRELIEILLNGWRVVAIIIVISLLFSAIFSIFIQKPFYEANTILMASDISGKIASFQNDSKDAERILDLLEIVPNLTIETYKQQIVNPQLLQQVKDELEKQNYKTTVNDLHNMIGLETIPNTNLISIKVTNEDPILAANIANSLAKKFTAFITSLSQQQASKSSLFIEGQLETEKKKLDEASLELKELLSQPRGVEEMKAEFDSKLKMLTSFKTQSIEKEVELNKIKAGLIASEQELRSMPQVIITKKSVGEDPLLNQVFAERNNTSVSNMAQISMESEEVNPSYTSLESKVSEYKVKISELSQELTMISEKITMTQKELENIQLELADKEHKQTLLQRNVNLSQDTYDAYLSKYEESRIAESTQVGDSSINIISQAVVPEFPTGPNKVLNMAVAGILGVMIGMFVVFFREYWRITGAQAINKNITINI